MDTTRNRAAVLAQLLRAEIANLTAIAEELEDQAAAPDPAQYRALAETLSSPPSTEPASAANRPDAPRTAPTLGVQKPPVIVCP